MGPHFGGFSGAWGIILVVREGAGNALGIYCSACCIRLARAPRIERILKLGGKSLGSGPRTSSTTDCWTGTTGLKDCRN